MTLALAATSLVLFSGAAKSKAPRPRPNPVHSDPAPPPPEPLDLKGAVPAKSLQGLPSTADQVRQLNSDIAKQKPLVAGAQAKSETLAAEAKALKEKLIATAARIAQLENDTIRFDADIVRLTSEDAGLTQSFQRDRVSVSRLLALLERLQHDMPPAMVLKPDDALGAVRGAMLVGATLPNVYGQAAELARRIELLKKTRADLVARKAEAAHTAIALEAARSELDQLLARKQVEADQAASQYGNLAARLAAAADQAANLQALLVKVAQLRGTPNDQSITLVTADTGKGPARLAKDSLLRPVAGPLVPLLPGTQDPGLTFATPAGAQVLAPADGKVLFAGPYHKSGQVLILEMAAGYDLVLSGLGRVEVRPEDQLLAGEPVGTMPKTGDLRLYFVMRQDGREISPAPWMKTELRKAN